MNELVQDFMVEAGFARRLIHPSSPDSRHISVDPEIKKKVAKFSELIIQECKKIADAQSSVNISNHFGVK